ncbi:MAG TPA: hypothetical protein VJQ77_02555 [Novosphingobium sp.]|nr:hypothetical protein [Novosphingobium sp.]
MKISKILAAGAIISALVCAGPVAAKEKAAALTGLQLQQIQSHDIEADKSVVFSSVMSVLQDAGYRIQAADLETGLITGLGSSQGKLTYNLFWGFGKSKKTPFVSAYIEKIGPSVTRIRLNFVMAKVKSNLYSSQPQDEEPIIDAAVYKDAFEKVDQAVFLRQSMNTTPQEPAVVPAAGGASAETKATAQ